MNAQRNTKLEEQRTALAKLALVDAKTAAELIGESSQTEELIASLSGYPGALEALALEDSAPRWVKSCALQVLALSDVASKRAKSLAREMLEESGTPILS